jgi:hypothetical protein
MLHFSVTAMAELSLNGTHGGTSVIESPQIRTIFGMETF